MTAPRRGSGGSPARRAGSPGGGPRGAFRGGSSGRPQRPASGTRGRSGGDAGDDRRRTGGEGNPRAQGQDRRAGGSGTGRGDWRDRRPSQERPQRDDGDRGRGQGPRRFDERPSWQDRRPNHDRPRRDDGDRPRRPEQRGQRSERPTAGGDRRDRRPDQARPRRAQERAERPERPSPAGNWRDRRPGQDRPRGDDGGRPRRAEQGGERREARGASGRGGDWRDRRPSTDRRAGGRPQRERSPRVAVPAGPEVPDWADPGQLDTSVRAALRGLEPRNAERVARHLVVAGALLDEDPDAALAHARAARDRASRVAAVREAVGVAAYHVGDYAEAARELRAYRRMSGDVGYRAVLADCERGLGRPEVALRLVTEALTDAPDREELVELRLVEAGARRDLGEEAAARLVLEDALGGRPRPHELSAADPGRLRLAAAYADLLRAEGDEAQADVWAEAVAAADVDDVTGLGGDDVVFDEEELEAP